MNAMLIDFVTLRSLTQRLEQFVITAFPRTRYADQIIRKKELLQEILNPPLTTSCCQRKPAHFHSPVWSMTQICY